MSYPSYNRALHRLAILTAIATFPLIFMGGRVTTMGAGMSVPDWPNSYGYNMFLFPPSQWVGGVLFEHTHRLMGTVVGFLAIMLTLFAWGPARHERRRRKLQIGAAITGIAAFVFLLILLIIKASKATHVAEVFHRTSHFFVLAASAALVLLVASLARRQEPRRWVRWLMAGVLFAVCLQGLLGGLRVTEVNLVLAIVHGCFAQIVFCTMALAALVTSNLWDRLKQQTPTVAAKRLATLAAVSVVAVLYQLIVGAVMRHYDAGLAIPDLPLHYGKVLPPMDDAALAEANLARANSGSPDLRPVTLAQIWLHMGHRVGAVLVTVLLALVIWRSLRGTDVRVAARNPALLLIPLLLIQLTLGVLTVVFHKPADIASLHVATGALVLLTTFSLAVRARVASRGLPVSAEVSPAASASHPTDLPQAAPAGA